MTVVSVVIPSFRGGKYLREAVASVQAQTLTDWELIIVLDGCDDDLSDIEKADQRVRVIRQRNRGASIARNVGVSHARSEFVALLDDDDLMLPERLQAQVDAMSDKSIGICHTQYRYIDQNGTVTGAGVSKEYTYRDFLRGDGKIHAGTAMFRKDLFQAVGGYNPLLTFGEDLDLFYRMARESTVCFVPEILFEYRQHGSNLWLNTNLGSDGFKITLAQHLVAAKVHGETENVKAVRRGLLLIPSDRVAKVMVHAHEARLRHDRVGLFIALSHAFFLSPRFTTRAVLRGISKPG
jgi:glycosyltransferase involved in cell wall biosynthesis